MSDPEREFTTTILEYQYISTTYGDVCHLLRFE